MMTKGLWRWLDERRGSGQLADGRTTTYWYAWRGGPRLDGQPGTSEFMASYNRAIAARPVERGEDLNALVDEFRDSSAYCTLAPKTQKDYGRILTTIARKFGDCPAKLLGDRRLRKDFLAWKDEIAKSSPRAADYTFAVFARVLSWAFNLGLIRSNVLESHGRIWKGSRAEHIWTDEDEARLLQVAGPAITLAFKLALATGERESDLLRLTWSAYDGEFIRLRQSKGKKHVAIPVTRDLKAALDATARVSVQIIVSRDGKPFTSDGFRASWRKICQRAGIAGLTFHDLRGTAVTRMAKAGATEIEIASVTGHTTSATRSILEKHYLGHDPELATNAIQKLEKRTDSANRAANRSLRASAPKS